MLVIKLSLSSKVFSIPIASGMPPTLEPTKFNQHANAYIVINGNHSLTLGRTKTSMQFNNVGICLLGISPYIFTGTL